MPTNLAPAPARPPRTPLEIPDHVALRALRAFTVDPDTGCHLSTLGRGSHGYPQIHWRDDTGRGRCTTVHRAAWAAVHGQIPTGMTIDHTCKERACVDPSHLRLLTNYENARRTSGRDWPLGECAHGHPNTELQLIGGRWNCGVCAGEWQRRRQERLRATRTRKAA